MQSKNKIVYDYINYNIHKIALKSFFYLTNPFDHFKILIVMNFGT